MMAPKTKTRAASGEKYAVESFTEKGKTTAFKTKATVDHLTFTTGSGTGTCHMYYSDKKI